MYLKVALFGKAKGIFKSIPEIKNILNNYSKAKPALEKLLEETKSNENRKAITEILDTLKNKDITIREIPDKINKLKNNIDYLVNNVNTIENKETLNNLKNHFHNSKNSIDNILNNMNIKKPKIYTTLETKMDDLAKRIKNDKAYKKTKNTINKNTNTINENANTINENANTINENTNTINGNTINRNDYNQTINSEIKSTPNNIYSDINSPLNDSAPINNYNQIDDNISFDKSKLLWGGGGILGGAGLTYGIMNNSNNSINKNKIYKNAGIDIPNLKVTMPLSLLGLGLGWGIYKSDLDKANLLASPLYAAGLGLKTIGDVGQELNNVVSDTFKDGFDLAGNLVEGLASADINKTENLLKNTWNKRINRKYEGPNTINAAKDNINQFFYNLKNGTPQNA